MRSGAQGHDFGMGGRVAAQDGLIEAAPDDTTIRPDDNGTYGNFTAAAGLLGQFDGDAHEFGVLLGACWDHGKGGMKFLNVDDEF